jgi:hypothetical protein
MRCLTHLTWPLQFGPLESHGFPSLEHLRYHVWVDEFPVYWGEADGNDAYAERRLEPIQDTIEVQKYPKLNTLMLEVDDSRNEFEFVDEVMTSIADVSARIGLIALCNASSIEFEVVQAFGPAPWRQF